MANNLSYIVSLCEKLQSQQLEPTVAKVRQSADRPLSLPEVINVLKRWKADPHQFPTQVLQQSTAEPAKISIEQYLSNLEKRVVELEAQVSKLTQALVALTPKA